jgi:membrane protein implicated in regulation of membrane protease activity
MYQGSITSAEAHRPIGSRSPPGSRSPLGTLAFLALVLAPFVAFAYPVATVALLTGTVALAVVSRSVLRTLRRRSGRVQTLTLPGLGTVEYRITTN